MQADSALEQLIGAYLNQDLFDLYPDVMAGVDDFATEQPALAGSLPSEIETTLSTHPEEDDLERLLTDLGVGFLPGDRTYREWLTQIAERVRAATAGG